MNKKSIAATDLFLAILAILLISVSFYQTWLGLSQIFGPASFVIALVLSLLLLFLCWMIRAAKIQGQPTGSLLGIYIFVASFCFIANFNALYTRFMRTDIYTTELRNINDKFNNLEIDIEPKLSYYVNDPKIRQAIKGDISILKSQITNDGNLGVGKLAEPIIERIDQQIGKGKGKITRLTSINNNKFGYADLANRYEQQINGIIYNLPTDQKDLKTDINNAVVKWNKAIQASLLQSKADIDANAQGLIEDSFAEYNKLGAKAQSILQFKFVPATSNTQELNKIGFAFTHAIKEHGMYQFVVLMGCILLDFIIVIIILLVTNPDNSTNNNRSNIKNRGRTLTPQN